MSGPRTGMGWTGLDLVCRPSQFLSLRMCRWLAGSQVDLAVIQCCATLEQGEDSPDAKQIRHLYERAVRDHGRANPGGLPGGVQ